MAKGKGQINGWITKNGVHIPIYGTYTVRGGVEPKAKGAKWKKKRPDDLRAKDINGQERLINRKDLEDALAEAKAKAAKADNENEWRQYAAEVRDIQAALDGKEVSPLVAKNYGKLSAKKKPSMSEEDKTARTVADHYGVSVDKAKEGIASGKYSDDDIKTAKDYKATMKNLEDKRDAGSISAEDYESSRKEAIKEFNESRKAKVEAGQEKGKTIEVNGKKINVKPGENNSQAIYRQAMEEQGKSVDKQFYDSQRADYNPDAPSSKPKAEQESSRTASNGAPRVSDEDAGRNKEVEWNGGKYQTQQVRDWDSDKKQEYVAGHLYVPVNPKNGEKQFFVANEDGSVHSSGTDYLNKKSQASSTPDFSKMSYSEAGQYVADHKKDFGLKDSDDAYLAAYQMKKGEWKGDSTLQENRDWAGRKNRETMIDSPESSTPKSTSKVSKTDAYNDKVFADFKANGKDYQRVPMEGYAGTANDFRAAAKRAGVEIEYDKGDDTFYLRKSKQDSLSAGTNERSRIRGELHAKDKAMKAAMPTTVSGLRSAYADATGSMKSKIASELRRKGYSLVGGKWIKGSKS